MVRLRRGTDLQTSMREVIDRLDHIIVLLEKHFESDSCVGARLDEMERRLTDQSLSSVAHFYPDAQRRIDLARKLRE